MTALRAEAVTKWFTVRQPRPVGHPWWRPRRVERLTALSEVDFAIEVGEAVGLLGANGAGKSTVVKLLTGLLVPDHGRVSVLGLDPHRDGQKCAWHIGVVFGQRSQLWWDLPARASFDILRAIYEIPAAEFASRIQRLDEVLGFRSFWERQARSMSLGQRVRADLAASLVHDPRVLFLDEPTIGLDVLVKDQVRALLADLATTGDHTIVLTSHDAVDIESLCPRLIVIDDGSVIYEGPTEKIAGLLGDQSHHVTAEFSQAVDIADDHVHGTVVTSSPTGASFATKPDATVGELAAELLARHPVRSITVGQPRLDNVLRALYAGDRGPSAHADRLAV